MTEYKRLEKLAKEKGWDLPAFGENTLPYFKYWIQKELGRDVKSPKKFAVVKGDENAI